MPEDDIRAEVERRLGRPFDDVADQLVDLFGMEWEEVEVVIETSAAKQGSSHADVIVDLIGRTDETPAFHQRVKRAAVRWIGKPWRERENPWDRFKDRVPAVPPRTDAGRDADDLEEWAPLRLTEDEDT